MRSGDGRMRSVHDLVVTGIYFNGIVSYNEWHSGNEANLVTIAFAEAKIAAALRGHGHWVSEVSPLDDALWQVNFLEEGRLLASARVNLEQATVLDYQLSQP